MTLIQGAILGALEGITEFLPISSTGHLILASTLLRLEQTDFLKSFEIIIQLGAISAVIFLYFKTLTNVTTLKKLSVAFLPTAVIGLILYKFAKAYLLGNTTVTLVALLLGGTLLIAFELFYRNNHEISTAGTETISYKQAILLGFAQSLAIIPGISRSGATILGGLMMKIDRKTIVEFSFLLAVPTMLAATGLDLVKNASSFSSDQFSVLALGFVTAFIVGALSIKFLLRIIRTYTFIPFGIYRILAALVFWFVIY